MNANDRIAEIDAEIERLKAEKRSLKPTFMDDRRLCQIDRGRRSLLSTHISYLARAAVIQPEKYIFQGREIDTSAKIPKYEELSFGQKKAAKALADRIIDLYEETRNSKPWEAIEDNEGGTHDE